VARAFEKGCKIYDWYKDSGVGVFSDRRRSNPTLIPGDKRRLLLS
jgi:hypothetical protein